VIRRREFITLVGGVAAMWPLAARGEQAAMPVIGYLNSQSMEANAQYLVAFRQALKEKGYVEGQTLSHRISLGRGSQRSTAGFCG
jgi:putative ABC transport system substrate-binding protein